MNTILKHGYSEDDYKFIRRTRIYRIFAAFFVVLIITITSVNTIRSTAKGDISVFVDAANNLLKGNNIYDTLSQSGLPYLYPPIYAFINIPLTLLPIYIIIPFWGILTVALLTWIFLAFFKGMHGNTYFSLSPKKRWAIGLFAVLLNVRFIHHHLAVAQANIVVLACAILGLVWISKDKAFFGAALVGISMTLKVLTIPFTFLFFAKRSTKIIIALILGIILGVLIPTVITGLDQNIKYHEQWFQKVIVKNAPGNRNWADNSNASLQAQLYRFFSDQPAFVRGGKDYKFTIITIPREVVKIMSWLLMLFIIFLIFFYNYRFKNESKLVIEWGAYALIFSLIPMFSTVSEKHHFLFVFPACVYIAYVWFELRLQDKFFRYLVVGSFLFTTLTTDGIWGRLLSDIFTGIGCIAFGTLLLTASIFRSAYCLTLSSKSNKKIESDSFIIS